MTHLITTVADANHLDQAKQLFASVYFNAGWKGDYMLLTYDTPEEKLGWFRERGILVRHCKPPDASILSEVDTNRNADFEKSLSEDQKRFVTRFRGLQIVLAKFDLFRTEFKKWDNIVYLDVDIIVRYSLDGLLGLRGFYAAPDQDNIPLQSQFFLHASKPQGKFYEQLKESYDLSTVSFNCGVMAFSTDIITEDTYNELSKVFTKYYNSSTYGEQPMLNLFFYKKWKKLNSAYNALILSLMLTYHVPAQKIDAVCLHFAGLEKPWKQDSPFYKEWEANFEKGDQIDLRNRPAGNGFFGVRKMIQYSLYFSYKKIVHSSYNYIDRQIGKCGIVLHKQYPSVYRAFCRIMRKS